MCIKASSSKSTYPETGANFYEDVETGMGFTNYSYEMASWSKECPTYYLTIRTVPCMHVYVNNDHIKIVYPTTVYNGTAYVTIAYDYKHHINNSESVHFIAIWKHFIAMETLHRKRRISTRCLQWTSMACTPS